MPFTPLFPEKMITPYSGRVTSMNQREPKFSIPKLYLVSLSPFSLLLGIVKYMCRNTSPPSISLLNISLLG